MSIRYQGRTAPIGDSHNRPTRPRRRRPGRAGRSPPSHPAAVAATATATRCVDPGPTQPHRPPPSHAGSAESPSRTQRPWNGAILRVRRAAVGGALTDCARYRAADPQVAAGRMIAGRARRARRISAASSAPLSVPIATRTQRGVRRVPERVQGDGSRERGRHQRPRHGRRHSAAQTRPVQAAWPTGEISPRISRTCSAGPMPARPTGSAPRARNPWSRGPRSPSPRRRRTAARHLATGSGRAPAATAAGELDALLDHADRRIGRAPRSRERLRLEEARGSDAEDPPAQKHTVRAGRTTGSTARLSNR